MQLFFLSFLFALAIYHRKHPGLHARYMVSTIFPLFTPVTDRLIHHHFKPILALVPKLEGIPLVPTAGFFAGRYPFALPGSLGLER
ncbi:MAG: hypothetical protein IPF93_14950 [Saprospiraceae bacterium]|nr:hypothetical protein [Saprospiraceae bacterium]